MSLRKRKNSSKKFEKAISWINVEFPGKKDPSKYTAVPKGIGLLESKSNELKWADKLDEMLDIHNEALEAAGKDPVEEFYVENVRVLYRRVQEEEAELDI